MKCRWIKLCQWLLGVLGISASIASCTPESGGGSMLVEYGQPNMDYSVKGKVVDSKTGAGVAGIEVKHEPWGSQIDTTGTDGSFEISGNTWPETNIRVDLRDIDPEKDGNYMNTQATVHLKQVKKGNGHWNEGLFEADDVILKVTKRDNE